MTNQKIRNQVKAVTARKIVAVVESVRVALNKVGVTDSLWIENFTDAIANHLENENSNENEYRDWIENIEDDRIEQIAAFYECYGYLPYNVSALDECYNTAVETKGEFVKENFEAYPASQYGEYYEQFCWETREFDDQDWDEIDWEDVAECLEGDNFYHFVEFNGTVHVFRVEQ